MSSLISISGLCRDFGSETVLDHIDLEIPPGRVYGLVGENGAGKTTLIKHCLGLYRAQRGTVRIFGHDPVADPPKVLGRIGFLSEDRDLPGWMSVAELLKFQAPFYPAWDRAHANEMLGSFGLSASKRISDLSRGQAAKLGLLVALAHRPELLLLDEPSSGLDPLARREILETLIQDTIAEGRTVFFSSHLLDEIERVCDWVGFLILGRLVLQGSLTEISNLHRRLVVRFDGGQFRERSIDGAVVIEAREKEWTLVSLGNPDAVKSGVSSAGGRVVDEQSASLEEIFLAYSRQEKALRTRNQGR